MTGIYIGSQAIVAPYSGATAIGNVYVGSEKIWSSNPLAGVNIGDSFRGGYYAGIIDTTKGNIDPADAYQTGKRYAIILAPISLQSASIQWSAANSSNTSAQTRWDGLSATSALNTTAFQAAHYCAGLAYPSDDASAWYLPAMDELELIYRNLKCSTESNYAGSSSGSGFPTGTVYTGTNPSSDPVGSAYTLNSPTQTTVAIFKSGGAQAVGASGTASALWSSTQYASSGLAWDQHMSGPTFAGQQATPAKTTTADNGAPVKARPIRRLILN